MKKAFFTTLAALAMLSVPQQADAQAFLNKLKDKATQAATNAVGKAIGGKINGSNKQAKPAAPVAAPVSQAAANSEPASTSYESDDEFQQHVEELVPTDLSYSYLQDFNFDEVANSTSYNFRSYADVLKAMPALPTEEQMVAKNPEDYARLRDYFHNVQSFADGITEGINDALVKARDQVNARKGTTTSAQREQMEMGAAEIFKLMQKYGIDPEKTSEEDMQKFFMQKIASGELKLPQGTGGIIETDYSDAQETAIDEITGKIEELDHTFYTIFDSEEQMGFLQRTRKATQDFCDSLRPSWLGSDACKQVYAIEKDIDERFDDYLKKHPDYGNNGAVIEYPAFWQEGRKQENSLITGFNMANAAQYRAALQEIIEPNIKALQEVPAIDAKLEATFPDKQDVSYATLKNRLNIIIVGSFRTLQVLYRTAFDMPIIYSVSEEKTIAM